MIEARPHPREIKWSLVVFAVAISVTASVVSSRAVFLASAAIVFGGGIAHYWLELARARLRFERGVLTYRGAVGRTRQIAVVGDGSKLVEVTPLEDRRGFSWLLWVNAAGASQLRLLGSSWDSSELQEIAEQVGAPVERSEGPIPIRKLDDRFPGAFFRYETHPGRTAAKILAALLVAMLIAAVIAGTV